METNERQHHLDSIQAVIGRMAQNSFSIKSWTVTIVSAMFALAADRSNPLFVLLGYFPVCAFWILDSYYLRQECLFRKLYDRVRVSESSLSYSMDTSIVLADAKSFRDIATSNTLLVFYGGIGFAIILVMAGLMRG